MDASFKQYDYQEGMALEEQVPFDAEALVATIEQGSTVNEAEGWVQGVPQQAVEDALTNYRTRLENHLASQAPDATVGDVLGTQQIKQVVHEQLAATLPYHLSTRKLVASVLPENLRWKFRYQLSTSLYGQPNAALLTLEDSTVNLAGRKLGLSFSPATEADAETLASFLPEPDENGDIDPSTIPDTLPGYLIELTGEFTVGSDVKATASASTAMGTELISEMGYWQPGRGWQASRNQPIAGEYRAIALDLQGTNPVQAQRLQADLEATQQKLTAEDYTDLSKHQVVGDLLYSTIFSYFALNGVQDAISQRQAGMVSYRAPSYGLFKTSLSPEYWFGIPRNVKADGLGMDVDSYRFYRVDEHNDEQKCIAFNRANGARMSAMEHLVPEQMYSTDTAAAHGVSAVKAIQLAATEGQKVYTITQANVSGALESLQLSSDIETDIRNAVHAGQEVTTHERPVDFFGKESVGYIIIDPNTGAGAYKIGGGENGSETESRLDLFLDWMAQLGVKGGKAKLVIEAFENIKSIVKHGELELGPVAAIALALKSAGKALEELVYRGAEAGNELKQELLLFVAKGLYAAGSALAFADEKAWGTPTLTSALMASSIILNTQVIPYAIAVTESD